MSEVASAAAIRAWTKLVRAQSRALAGVEADLKAAGFPPLGWYDALLELSRSEFKKLRPTDLLPQLLLAQSNVSRLVDRMAAAGYVERKACPGDGRAQFVAITEAGEALLKEMWPAYRAAISRHVGEKLGGDERAATLADLLDDLLKPCAA